MKLDIGCGALPKGDVNVDLYVGRTPHSEEKWTIEPQTIPNFVRCDANYLPFRDKAFSECVISHVLEHDGVRPIKVIKETLRVTKGDIEIRVPHRIWDRGRIRSHARYFNRSNIVALMRKLRLAWDINIVYDYLPHPYICLLRLPREIRVTIRGQNLEV